MKMEATPNLKFFIVDDDPFYRMLYRQHLLNLGYKNNILFDNGIDCIDNIGEQPDIILVDFNMLPCNGLEVIQKVKKDQPGIFMVLISSQTDNGIVDEARNSGAFDYIVKGEKDLEMISNSIKKIIKRKELIRTSLGCVA